MKFDLTKLVDEKYILSVLQVNKGKRIICFGAGTAVYLMPRILSEGVTIEYYLDSNPRLWGINEQGIEIRDPRRILEEKKGEYIVLVVSQHAMSMNRQLESYGLELNRDFYDFYTACEMYFRMEKVIFQADKLVKMIEKLPLDTFSKEGIGDKVGVVAACGYMGTPMIYDIGIFLLLRYCGYNAELILDNTYTCENFTMYEGASADIKLITDQITALLHDRFDSLTIRYIEDYQQMELDNEDKKAIDRQARINTTWQKSRQNKRSMEIPEDILKEKFNQVFENNLKNIKAFFLQHHDYKVLTVSTGLHYHRGFYTYEGQKYGMRVANYDGSNSDGKTSWGSDFPNGHHYDIPKLINESFFEKPVRDWMIRKAKEHFNNRRYAVSDGATAYNYQLVKDSEGDRCFDVFIPLNVMWDAAAIGLNKVFRTEKDWLIETVEFILNNTNASIIVREHPIQVQLEKYNNSSFKEALKEKFGRSERLYYAEYTEKINSYQILDRCKLVLPLSSTIGVEAAMMGKCVITHSACYYSQLHFVKAASDKKKYFDYIKEALKREWSVTESMKDEAFISYYLLMNSRIQTVFSEANPEWLFQNLEELSKDEGVHAILDSIVRDIPVPYYNILKLYHAENPNREERL